MSDHDDLRLRAITVSTRAALASLISAEDAPDVLRRAELLLGALERDVRTDGADPELLRRIGAARTELSAGRDEPSGH